MPTLGIRGANPIWAEVNLWGKLFDDNYYMYVLQNTIPYIPANVFHDPTLQVVWTNPIQFLGNGTLPIDIFFEPDSVYRLEFRQNDGINPPTQQDPLIYLVENYVPGSSGSGPGPITTVAFTSNNQISNPQFALVDFPTPFTLTGATNPDPIEIGPGWFLELTGTGNVTIQQVPLNDSNINPTNAPYALQLTLTGWATDGVILRQRFFQNGMLWANKIVSASLTAKVNGVSASASANLVDSNSSLLANVLTIPIINQSFNEFTGNATLPATTNPDVPPAAYIDYRLSLPSNVDIYLTSVQLVVQDLPVDLTYQQDSINRQIDYTYHNAYPIVPVGTVIDYFGFDTPRHYLPCNNMAISRQTYFLLFTALTHLETVTLTTGSPSFTVANGAIYAVGTPLEGTGIPAGAVINTIVTNTVTISANATAPGAQSVRFFATGNGDGSTTFNTPQLTDMVVAGTGGTLLSSKGAGSNGGAGTVTLHFNNIPAHVHAEPAASFGFIAATPGIGAYSGAGGTALGQVPQTGFNATLNTPVNNVQPTILANKMIRFE